MIDGLAPLAEAAEAAAQLLYPSRCAGCGDALWGRTGVPVCDRCYARVGWIGEGACVFCGAPAGAHAELGKGCERCRRSDLRVTRAVAAVRYASPCRELVHRLKFGGERRLAAALGERIAARVRETALPIKDASVVPVPVHRRRRYERGFNQSALLARVVSRALALPLREDLLRRDRHTPPQVGLPRRDRLRNLEGAFQVAERIEDAVVLLVDDVMTTGATVSECARALRDAGARRVYAALFARC